MNALNLHRVGNAARLLVSAVLLLVLSGCASMQRDARAVPRVVDLSEHFRGFDGAFMMLDPASGAVVQHNPARCAKRLPPCSTFKVPHALIALELGIVTDADHMFPWDGVERSRAVTNRDHTLRSAMQHSVVWYFQETARRIGEDRMRDWLARFDYGNGDISAGLTTFWLGTSLEISAEEQIEFLRRLWTGELPVSARSRAIVLETIDHGELSNGWRFYGKSGSDAENGRAVLGWFVGIVTRGDEARIYAVNITGRDGATGYTAAKEIVEEILASELTGMGDNELQ